jgi:hypothetical protein
MDEDVPAKFHDRAFWSSLSKALEAELREVSTFTGASDAEYRVEAVAIDGKGKRDLVFTSESNPRAAALIQSSIQLAMQGSKVLVARPVVFNLPAFARALVQRAAQLGWPEIGRRL